VLEAIHKVLGLASRDQPIGLHEPDFRGTQAWAYLKDCLDAGWVSTAGSWVSLRLKAEDPSIAPAQPAPAAAGERPRSRPAAAPDLDAPAPAGDVSVLPGRSAGGS